MAEWMWIATVFAAAFLVSFAFLQLVHMQRERARRRQSLAAAAMGDDVDDVAPELVLGGMTPTLAGQLPVFDPDKRKQLVLELQQAGFYRPTALTEFTAVRAVLVIMPLFFAGLLMLLIDQKHALLVLIGGISASALGYSLPRVYINSVARRRQREIEKGLPFAVDLLALGLLGGQNVMLALQRVCAEMRSAFPLLSSDLDIVRRQAELTSLRHALTQFADRVRVPEARNLVIILNQSQRQGTDIAPALMEFSNSFRSNLRQQADTRANQASVWLIFPSIAFLWGPAFAVLLAPVAFDFRAKRSETQLMLLENRERTAQIQALVQPRNDQRAAPNE
jgi:pilus assembly protein TadC